MGIVGSCNCDISEIALPLCMAMYQFPNDSISVGSYLSHGSIFLLLASLVDSHFPPFFPMCRSR